MEKRRGGVNIQLLAQAAVLLGLAAVLGYYGQDLLRKAFSPPPELTPQQEKLLRIIYAYQVKLGARKLVVGRDGSVYNDEAKVLVQEADVAQELLGETPDPTARNREFEIVMEGMPDYYLRRWSESRYGNPFIVAITDAGIRYLNSRR